MRTKEEITAKQKEIQAKYHADRSAMYNNQHTLFKSLVEYQAAEAKLDSDYKAEYRALKAEKELL